MKKVLLLLSMALPLQMLSASELYSSQTENTRIATASTSTKWTDFAATSFEGGEGTETSPYLIKTAEQLAKVAKDVADNTTNYAGTYFKLVSDINLEGHDWYPIGHFYSVEESNVQNGFGGIFDGDGHKIENLTITPLANFKSIGLFGETASGFELRNLTIESGTIEGEMVTGALVGSNNGIIENCVNKANVTCVYYYVGGIAGSNSREASIKHCSNWGKISAGQPGTNGMSAGGIAGTSYSTIEECANFADIEAATAGSAGIVGLMEGGTIRNCINRGNISGPERTGGIAADILGRGGNCEIYNCYSTGEINSPSTAGGVVGFAMFQNFNTLKIQNLYYSSDSFSGSAYGSITDIMGQFDIIDAPTMTSDEMKAETFVATLNEGSESETPIWEADTKNINDGFPVLSYMQQSENPGATTQIADNHIKVFGTDSKINVEGANNEQMQVYTVDGRMTYSGNAHDVQTNSGLYIVRIGNNSYKIVVK